MRSKESASPDVDTYISQFPPSTQKLLKQIRTVIKKAAPEADEGISYMMPAYKFHGMLVYFAGYQSHIGFYPGAGALVAFKKEVAGYNTSKGTVQLPLDKPLPIALISEIVAYRVNENLLKAEKKTKAKKKLKK